MKLLRLTLLFILPAFAAFAQTADNQVLMQRIDRLEHDLQIMQRQVSRGEPVTPPSGQAPLADNPAQLEVRLSAIEDSIRDLRGKIEENQFQVKKLSDNFDKLQKDTEFRFNELNKTQAPAAPQAQAAPDNPTTAAPAATAESPPGQTTAGDGVLRMPVNGKESPEKNFATPREHYNYAFRLLNQTQYDEAAAAFDSFTKKYPKDPLVGNAYYWMGETYYIRRDYVSAADDFRQGFEAAPEGPKAADNLLKLAMSLDALKRNKEACVVLQQITAKFRKSSTNVIDRAEQEQKRIGCK